MFNPYTKTNHIYCSKCSTSILDCWKGWPHRDPLPVLPKIISGKCQKCGGHETINSLDLGWMCYQSEFSTGLPDYFYVAPTSNQSKFGYPYFNHSECPFCSQPSVLSYMKYPNGTKELCHNCQVCGVIKALPSKCI